MAASTTLLAVWNGKMAGQGRLQSKTLDAPIAIPSEMKGSGNGSHPKELLAASAASCYLMTLAAMMDSRKLPAADFTVKTTLTGQADGGFSINHDTCITFSERAGSDDLKRAEELLVAADNACMVGNLLRRAGVGVIVQGVVAQG